MKSLLICATLLCLAAISSSTPGLKVAVTPNAINDLLHDYVPKLLANLTTITIPPVNDGKIKISDINITSLYIPGDALEATFTQDHFVFSSSDFGLSATLHLQDKIWAFIGIDNNFGVSTNDSKLSFDLSFGYDNDHLQVKLNSLSVEIKSLEIKYPSGLGYLILRGITFLFRGLIERKISRSIGSALSEVLPQAINSALTNVSNYASIPGTHIGIDYGLTQAITINPSYLSVFLNGTFYEADQGFSVPPVVQGNEYPEFDNSSDDDIQVFISEYTFNTALYSIWSSGQLKFNITDKMIPAEAGFVINIDWLTQFIPNLTNYYNNTDQPVLTSVNVQSAPTLNITEGDVQISANLLITFYALNDTTPTEIVTVTSTLTLGANATLSNWTVAPHIIGGSFGPFTLTSSYVGEFDPSTFQTGLNMLLVFGLPTINAAKLNFPLPQIPNIDLTATTVEINNGYIQIGAYPHYNSKVISSSAKLLVELFEKHYENVMRN